MLIKLPLLYLPPLSWFASAGSSQGVILGSGIPYRKQTYRNRCVIMSANGPLTLSVPVLRAGGKTPFDGIRTDPTRPWQRNHWRAIESAYSRSPFFLYYKDALEPYFQPGSCEKLEAHNRALVRTLFKLMKLKVTEIDTTDLFDVKNGVTDLSSHFLQDAPLPDGIALVHPEYRQVFAERIPFHSNLSVIDLLFNLGPESSAYLRKMTLFASD